MTRRKPHAANAIASASLLADSPNRVCTLPPARCDLSVKSVVKFAFLDSPLDIFS